MPLKLSRARSQNQPLKAPQEEELDWDTQTQLDAVTEQLAAAESTGAKKSRTRKSVAKQEPVAVETPVEAPPATKRRAKAQKATATAAVAVAVEEPAHVEEVEREEDGEDMSAYSTIELLNQITSYRKLIRESETAISKRLKKIASNVRRDQKKGRGAKDSTTLVKRQQKKRPIVDSLADLIGVPRGTELARGDVQSVICKYVKEHELKCEDDKKCFDTDDALEAVIGAPRFAAHANNSELRHSFNNLMKIINDLFVPVEKVSEE